MFYHCAMNINDKYKNEIPAYLGEETLVSSGVAFHCGIAYATEGMKGTFSIYLVFTENLSLDEIAKSIKNYFDEKYKIFKISKLEILPLGKKRFSGAEPIKTVLYAE